MSLVWFTICRCFMLLNGGFLFYYVLLLTSVPIAPVLTTEVLHVHLARYPVKPVVLSLISRFDSDNAHSVLFLFFINPFQISLSFSFVFFFIFFSSHGTISNLFFI